MQGASLGWAQPTHLVVQLEVVQEGGRRRRQAAVRHAPLPQDVQHFLRGAQTGKLGSAEVPKSRGNAPTLPGKGQSVQRGFVAAAAVAGAAPGQRPQQMRVRCPKRPPPAPEPQLLIKLGNDVAVFNGAPTCARTSTP